MRLRILSREAADSVAQAGRQLLPCSQGSSLAQDAIAPQAAISIAKARMSPVVVGAMFTMALNIIALWKQEARAPSTTRTTLHSILLGRQKYSFLFDGTSFSHPR